MKKLVLSLTFFDKNIYLCIVNSVPLEMVMLNVLILKLIIKDKQI